MNWTAECKREACLHAPMSATFLRPDTSIVERPGWYQVITPSAATTANEVVLSQVSERDADRAIEETIAAYGEYGIRTKWCVGYWTSPNDFGGRLHRRGFREWNVRGMGCSSSLAIQAPNHVTVDEVTEQNLHEYLAVMTQGWGLPETEIDVERRVLLATLRASPRHGFLYLARMDGRAVGTAALVLRGDY